ncbi:MAG: hypothetical protein N2327_02060 [Caldimicrobium sp.]|nr:hypothetical protein [Caldimicrobium sp.]MDW8095084.1 hypothetical protein [Caldimicrobium sp.]
MKKIVGILAILALLFPAISVAQENLCQVKISASTKGKRNVFLAGGEAYILFESYITQARANNIRVDPTTVVVHLWDGGRLVSYEVGFMERMNQALAGRAIMDIWKRKLANVKAQYNEQELRKAHELGWDIVCLGETKQVKMGEMKQLSLGTCSSEAKNHINAGLSFINTKQVDNAIKEFEYAIKVSPTCTTAYANLVSAHVVKGNYNLAIEKFNEGLKKAGEDPFLYITGAVAYTKSKQYDMALQTLEKAVSMKQKDEKRFSELVPFLESKEFDPLIQARRKDFCELMVKHYIPNRKCR